MSQINFLDRRRIEYRILMYLYNFKEEQAISEIRKEIKCMLPSSFKGIKSLDSLGLIKFVRSGAKRRKYFKITKEGIWVAKTLEKIGRELSITT